ncbi:hypothetical protein C7271_17465 [filamentous cyanobacterium CCP5]|nr:hypothetical protein C7271_17465 [filamentous cyanobacterium CCP5]
MEAEPREDQELFGRMAPRIGEQLSLTQVRRQGGGTQPSEKYPRMEEPLTGSIQRFLRERSPPGRRLAELEWEPQMQLVELPATRVVA